MESWQRQYLGLETVPASLTSAEIEFFFAPSEQEGIFIGTRRRPLTRLGLILQIGFLRMTGRLLARAAAHAGMPAPRNATLRSIYRRRITLFQHPRNDACDLTYIDTPYGFGYSIFRWQTMSASSRS